MSRDGGELARGDCGRGREARLLTASVASARGRALRKSPVSSPPNEAITPAGADLQPRIYSLLLLSVIIP